MGVGASDIIQLKCSPFVDLYSLPLLYTLLECCVHRNASTKEMCSSLSPSSLFLSTDSRFVLQNRCYIPTFGSYVNNWRFRNSRVLCLSASIVERNFEFSWLSPDENGNDAYGGWEIVEAPIETKKQHQKGLFSILY